MHIVSTQVAVVRGRGAEEDLRAQVVAAALALGAAAAGHARLYGYPVAWGTIQDLKRNVTKTVENAMKNIFFNAGKVLKMFEKRKIYYRFF